MSNTFQVSNGDIYILPDSGRFVTITDEQKLGQDLAESLMTDFDSTRDFGSELNALASNPQQNASASYISQLVVDAVNRLQNYQRNNQQASSGEIIQSIQTIRVIFNPQDPTTAYFYLVVVNQAGVPLPTTMSVTQLNQQITPAAAAANTPLPTTSVFE